MRAKSLETVIKKTSERLGIPEKTVKDAIYHKYDQFRIAIRDMTHPEILDQYFCRYTVLPHRLKESLNYKDIAEIAEKHINRRKKK